MERHSTSALKLAEYMEGNPDAERVKYPFLPSHPLHDVARKQMRWGGGILAFTLPGESSGDAASSTHSACAR